MGGDDAKVCQEHPPFGRVVTEVRGSGEGEVPFGVLLVSVRLRSLPGCADPPRGRVMRPSGFVDGCCELVDANFFAKADRCCDLFPVCFLVAADHDGLR